MPGVLGWVAVRGSTGMGDSGPFRDSLPVAISPLLLGIAGHTYMVGAAALGLGLLYFGIRLAQLRMPPASATSRFRARQLLQATIVYLPVLLGLMMSDSAR
jgi:heme o synthase